MRVEQAEQISLHRMIKFKFPDMLFTTAPGGMKTSMKQAVAMKAMGYRAGTPDLLIFEPRGKFHGLLLELKAPKTLYSEKGRTSPEQKEFIAAANARGYYACVAYGAIEAFILIEKYMAGQSL
jgi:hypothetical protein